MKKYISPCIEITLIDDSDIITSSLGTETGIVDETDGSWDLDINP